MVPPEHIQSYHQYLLHRKKHTDKNFVKYLQTFHGSGLLTQEKNRLQKRRCELFTPKYSG